MTTTANPLDVLTKHGTELKSGQSLTEDTELFDSIALFVANLKDGTIPKSYGTQMRAFLKDLNTTAENGGDMPALGSATGSSGGSDIKPEHRALIRAVEDGTIELDGRTGLPKAPAPDDSQLNDALKRLEKELGLTVATSSPKMRLDGIVESIKDLNDGKSDDVMGLVKIMADAVGVTQNNGESDQKFAERAASVVADQKALADEARTVERTLKIKTGLDPRAGEAYGDYTARMIKELEQSGKSGGGFFSGRGHRE